MKLGLSSYTFGWAVAGSVDAAIRPLDENGLLDRCHEHGLQLLQIGDNLPLHTFNSSRLADFADRANQESVQLEIGTSGLTVGRVAEYAAIARRVGAPLIRLVIDDNGYHPTPEVVIDQLRKAAPMLDGLVLGLENHDRFPARTLRQILESVGKENIGICLDTANSLGAGEGLQTVLNELAPFAVNLHLKDFAVARVSHLMGFTVEGRPAGEGMLDIPDLLRQVTAIDRCETAVLELWTPPELQIADTIAKEAAWAARSIGYLRPLFAESI